MTDQFFLLDSILGGGLIFLIALIPLAIMIWALVDVLRSSFSDSTTKLIWVILIVLLPLLGSILWFILGRSQRVAV